MMTVKKVECDRLLLALNRRRRPEYRRRLKSPTILAAAALTAAESAGEYYEHSARYGLI